MHTCVTRAAVHSQAVGFLPGVLYLFGIFIVGVPRVKSTPAPRDPLLVPSFSKFLILVLMMSHAEPVIGLPVVFHPYCRHPSDGGAHQTDWLGVLESKSIE